MKAEITINSEGGVNGKSNFSLTGWQYDMYLSLDGLSNKEASDALKSRFSELNYETANINNFKTTVTMLSCHSILIIRQKLFKRKIGQDLLFRAIPFNELTSINNIEERKLPFENAFAYADDYEIIYNIPAGYKISEMPQSQSISSAYGNYSLKAVTNDKTRLSLKDKLQLTEEVTQKNSLQIISHSVKNCQCRQF